MYGDELMKKILLILLLVPVLTACGGNKNTLKCTLDTSDTETNYFVQEINMDFDSNDKITKANTNIYSMNENVAITDSMLNCEKTKGIEKLNTTDGVTIKCDFSIETVKNWKGTDNKTELKGYFESVDFKCEE